MAFTSALKAYPPARPAGSGFRKQVWTYTNTGGSTGGAVETGFAFIESTSTTQNSAAVASQASSVIAAGTVTLITDADVDGELTVCGRGVA